MNTDEHLGDAQESNFYISYMCGICNFELMDNGNAPARYCSHCGASLEESRSSNKPDVELSTDQKRVLIAEDTAVLRKAVARMVIGLGNIVVETADGQEALDAARQETPDLIISDINMPNMSGMEFIEKLQADDALKDVPIIMLTSMGDAGTINKAMRMGVIDYILKSTTNPQEIRERLQKHL